jgi:hypothetical protein
VKYPELFTEPTPGLTHFMKSYGVDLTGSMHNGLTSRILGILMRPHAEKLLSDIVANKMPVLYPMMQDILEKLDVDLEEISKAGIERKQAFGNDTVQVTMSFLNEVIYNIHKIKSVTQKALERKAKMNANTKEINRRKHMLAVLSEHGVVLQYPPDLQKAYNKILRNAHVVQRNAVLKEHGIMIPSNGSYGANRARDAAYSKVKWNPSPHTANLVGLNVKPEEDLLKFPAREEELKGLFSGGNPTRTLRYRRKHRNARKTRKHKSRK